MVETFYTVAGAVAFTLYGLWWIVVQAKPEWRQDRARRLLAYVVSLHFLLPGAMSLLSVVAPNSPLVWQTVFTAAGILGIMGVAMVLRAVREDHDAPWLVATIQWVVLPVYVLITILALAPGIPSAIGLPLSGLQVEAIVVTAVLIFGVQSAWFLMVEPPRAATPSP
jgi:hypothetical protein